MAAVVGIGDFIGWEGGCLLVGKAISVVPKHSHLAIQIVFGYADPVRLREGDDGEWTTYPFCIIPSRQPHSMDATASTYNAVIFVEPETRGGRALTEKYLQEGVVSLDDARVRDAAAALFSVWLRGAGKPAVRDAARRILDALTEGFEPAVITDPRIVRAVAHINAHIQEEITLDDVAATAFLSPGRFRHLFVEQTGIGLRPYVLWRRFLLAWELLATGKSVSTVAHEAGFADSAHFARTSRQMFGFPPSLLQVNGSR